MEGENFDVANFLFAQEKHEVNGQRRIAAPEGSPACESKRPADTEKYGMDFPKREWSHRLSLRGSRRAHEVTIPSRIVIFFGTRADL